MHAFLPARSDRLSRRGKTGRHEWRAANEPRAGAPAAPALTPEHNSGGEQDGRMDREKANKPE